VSLKLLIFQSMLRQVGCAGPPPPSERDIIRSLFGVCVLCALLLHLRTLSLTHSHSESKELSRAPLILSLSSRRRSCLTHDRRAVRELVWECVQVGACACGVVALVHKHAPARLDEVTHRWLHKWSTLVW
jgi:hypothetical protein